MMLKSSTRVPTAAPTGISRQLKHVVRVPVSCRAAEKSGLANLANSMGFPTEEGIFGFKPFAETWCGRLAMAGFLTSIIQEGLTGEGTLGQLGFTTPNTELLGALSAIVGMLMLVGTADTANKLLTKKMTGKEIARFKHFLGLDNPNDFMAAATNMKRQADFTRPNVDIAAIEKVRAEGMPADKFLGVDTFAQADAASSELKANDTGIITLTKEEEAAQVAAADSASKTSIPTGPSVSMAAREDIRETMFTTSYEMAYARSVELTNGRWAMMGFLAAILVEAGTGKGIILQVIMYLKMSGLLGAASGF